MQVDTYSINTEIRSLTRLYTNTAHSYIANDLFKVSKVLGQFDRIRDYILEAIRLAHRDNLDSFGNVIYIRQAIRCLNDERNQTDADILLLTIEEDGFDTLVYSGVAKAYSVKLLYVEELIDRLKSIEKSLTQLAIQEFKDICDEIIGRS